MYISDLDLKVTKPFNNVEMSGMQSGSLNPKEAKTREENHRKQSGDARRREGNRTDGQSVVCVGSQTHKTLSSRLRCHRDGLWKMNIKIKGVQQSRLKNFLFHRGRSYAPPE